MKLLRPLAAALFASMLSPVFGGTPLGGLGVAATLDGTRLVIGGDSRTLYVVDAASMEVKHRIWSGTSIKRMFFNKDGSRLWVEDTSGVSQIYETEKFSVVHKIPKAAYLSAAPQADVVVALEAASKGHILRAFSLTDWSEKGTITFPKGIKVGSFGLDATGTKLAVLTKDSKDPDEPKMSSSKAPKELKGIDKVTWKQKHDGKTSLLKLFDLPSFTETLEKKTWYKTMDGSLVFIHGSQTHVVNYNNENIRFSPEGEGALFKSAHGLNYGMGVSGDRTAILGGSMASGSRTNVADLVGSKFKLDRLPGWPEYFRGFAFGPDGTGYGTTSGYRLARFKPSGAIDKVVPIY